MILGGLGAGLLFFGYVVLVRHAMTVKVRKEGGKEGGREGGREIG